MYTHYSGIKKMSHAECGVLKVEAAPVEGYP